MIWEADSYGCLTLHVGSVYVWITPRPRYCDRGHYQAGVDGIPSIDAADAFPRYYMNLDRAKLEMEEWLTWRLHSEGQKR